MSTAPTRQTPHRKAIVEAISAHADHPTADQVFFAVRTMIPNISLGTVYRNLNMLVRNGVIAELSTPDNIRRYDGRTTPHGHVICTKCGKISDVFPPEAATQEIRRATEDATGYRVAWCQVELYGQCPQCRETDHHA